MDPNDHTQSQSNIIFNLVSNNYIQLKCQKSSVFLPTMNLCRMCEQYTIIFIDIDRSYERVVGFIYEGRVS